MPSRIYPVRLRLTSEEMVILERLIPLFGGSRSKTIRHALRVLAVAAPQQDKTPAA